MMFGAVNLFTANKFDMIPIIISSSKKGFIRVRLNSYSPGILLDIFIVRLMFAMQTKDKKKY